MKSLTKKILIILSIVLMLGTIFAIPMFAETQDELKQIFVTRDEWAKWINVDGITLNGTTMGMSEYLKVIENINQVRVQDMVKEEFIKRGLKVPTESSGATP